MAIWNRSLISVQYDDDNSVLINTGHLFLAPKTDLPVKLVIRSVQGGILGSVPTSCVV